jgi:hypothetical protein
MKSEIGLYVLFSKWQKDVLSLFFSLMVIKIPAIVAVSFIGYNTFYSRYLSAPHLVIMISTTLITSLITLFCGVLHT